MDVEGWEIAALRGARQVLTHAQVAVEMHPSAWEWSGHTRHDFERLLTDYGLRAVGLNSQADVFEDYGHAHLARAV